MAVTDRSGSQGTAIALGKQSAYGTPVKLRTGMIPVLFPVSAITLDGNADTEESNLITAFGSAPPVEIGQEYADGGFTTRILPEYFYHILEGILNPSPAASVQLGEKPLGALASGTVTITNASYPGDGTPLADVGYPSKIKFTGITGTGTITIRGKRKAGRQIGSDDRLSTFDQTETITVASGTTAESTKFYASVDTDGITFTGITAATMAWDPDTWKSIVQFQATDPQFEGWTALPLKGGVPNRATDYVPGEMSISASGSGIDVTINGVGTRYDERRTISDAANFDAEVFALEADDTSYYANPSLKSFPGWAGALIFGDTVVKYTSIDFNINRNYENSPGISGEKFKYGVDATGNRLVTFSPTSYLRSGTVSTDTFLRLQQLFRDEARESLTMRNLAYDGNGRQYQMDWACASSQIESYPRSEVSGPGRIERPLVFRALPGAGNVPELVVTIYTPTQIYT